MGATEYTRILDALASNVAEGRQETERLVKEALDIGLRVQEAMQKLKLW